MTRLIRRAVLAMVAASAGIVLHGQTTTADNALFDLSGLTAPGRGTDPTSAPPLLGDILGLPPTITLPTLPLPALQLPLPVLPNLPVPTIPVLPTLPPFPGNRPAPVPPSPDPDVGLPLPPVIDPDVGLPLPPVIDPVVGQPVPPISDPPVVDPDVGQPLPPVTDPGASQPVPPIADPPSADPDVGTPPTPDEAGRPPANEPGGSGDPAPSSGDPTAVDALPPPGPADGVTTPGTGGSNRGTGATTAAGEATGSAAFLARHRRRRAGAASDAPHRPRPGDPTVDLVADDTVASGGAVDAEVEGPVAETWVPSGGGGQGLPFAALGAVLAVLGALWIVIAVVRRAIDRRGQWADEPSDLGREPDRVSAGTRSSSREPSGASADVLPIRREPVRASADARPNRREPSGASAVVRPIRREPVRASADARPIRREPSRASADARSNRREPRSGVGGRPIDAVGRDRRVLQTPPARSAANEHRSTGQVAASAATCPSAAPAVRRRCPGDHAAACEEDCRITTGRDEIGAGTRSSGAANPGAAASARAIARCSVARRSNR